MPVWAIIVGATSYEFASYALLAKMPAYMDEVLGLHLVQVRVSSAQQISDSDDPYFLCKRVAATICWYP